MTDFYLAHAVGVEDGTKIPPNKYDGRSVGAKKKIIVANHPAGVAYANGDRFFLAALKAGEQIARISVVVPNEVSETTLMRAICSPALSAARKNRSPLA